MSKDTVIHVSDGKYTFIEKEDDYRIHCFRYGEPWMVFSKGYNAISGLIYKYQKLQSENERLRAEIESVKPKPLLFGFLDDFRIYIMPEVPENQIWFATHEQLSKAIEYSIHFIEKRYGQTLKETKE